MRGINHFSTVTDRRNATLQLFKDELKNLQQGFNPIVSNIPAPVVINTVDSNTPFIKALEYVKSTISTADFKKRDLKSILGFVSSAAAELKYDSISIDLNTRRHIKLLLIQIEKNQGKESHHQYNKVRSYLMILFKELVELEAIEPNSVREIAKKNGIEVLRDVLSFQAIY